MDRLISADALMREVETCISNNKQLIDEWFANIITDVIDEQPTVEAVRQGHWIDVNGDGSLWRCSVCGETQCCKSNYCGDCGAKMQGDSDGNK